MEDVKCRFRSGFGFRSDFYVRDSGGTTASPCAWLEDHERGQFATYLARTCHYGCRISFPGRPLRSRLAWQVAATYVTWRCGWIVFAKIRYTYSTQNRRKWLTKSTTLPWYKLYARNVENWPKLGTTSSNQSGNGKLNQHSQDLFCCRKCKLQRFAIDYRNQRTRQIG